MDKSCIICRCEEISYAEIEDAIEHGARSLDEIKKYSRAGMGPCQGRICSNLITKMLKQKGVDPKDAPPPHSRMPVRPVKISKYLEDDNCE